VQRVAKHFFDRAVGAVGLVVLAAARSVPEQHPVGSAITRPTKASGIDEGLCKVNWVAIRAFPVVGKSRYHAAENVRGQIGTADPGQNQKTSIVGDEANVVPPRFRTPADVAIPAAEVARRRTPRHTRNRPAVRPGQVF
jgi:hypothetical protein